VAYLQDLNTHCDLCTATAFVRLLSRRNIDYGKFCRVCGKRRLKELQAEEDKALQAAKER
jgi:hypothetical protein